MSRHTRWDSCTRCGRRSPRGRRCPCGRHSPCGRKASWVRRTRWGRTGMGRRTRCGSVDPGIAYIRHMMARPRIARQCARRRCMDLLAMSTQLSRSPLPVRLMGSPHPVRSPQLMRSQLHVRSPQPMWTNGTRTGSPRPDLVAAPDCAATPDVVAAPIGVAGAHEIATAHGIAAVHGRVAKAHPHVFGPEHAPLSVPGRQGQPRDRLYS